MATTDPHSDELIGQTIAGRYRIISQLGAGGMGVAYRAWHEQAAVPVVVKIPKKAFLEDPKFAERFNREIRLLQGLTHPNIVPIVDVGEHQGLPYVVMRFLPGGSLSNRRLRDDQRRPKPNPIGMLHLWLPAVADALDHVHANGAVHRDVKPANIFFDAFWAAFLGDFGIAKIIEESDSFDREHTLTATNMGIGTAEYMAPEQFAPKAVIDGRVDQYALAVIVYEMLAGVRPFTGETAHIAVEVLTHSVPPLSRHRSDLPATLVGAVNQGLAKKPAERFATCREFANAVLRNVPVLEDEPDVARLLCPRCGNILKLPAAAAGQRGKCPRCQTRMEVADDLGALWLLDEARRQRASTAGVIGDEFGFDSADASSAVDEDLLQEFQPVSGTTPVSRSQRQSRPSIFTWIDSHGLAVAGVMTVLAAVSWLVGAAGNSRQRDLNRKNNEIRRLSDQLAEQSKQLESVTLRNPTDPQGEAAQQSRREFENLAAAYDESLRIIDEHAKTEESLRAELASTKAELENLRPMIRISLAKLHDAVPYRKPGYLEEVMAVAAPISETHIQIPSKDFTRIQREYALARSQELPLDSAPPEPMLGPSPSSPPREMAPFDASQARKHQEAWAKHLGIEVETTNSIGLTLVVIPPGRFTMGEGNNTVDVTLTKPFLLGQTEVTNAQWKRVMGSVPSNWRDDDLPVEKVNWDDAVAFCQKLSALPKERQAGREYRLPTEAEWEYACRSGTTTKYSFGDDESRLGEYGWFKDNSGQQTHAVGKKKPNAWGLFDMHGNVWEWCSDWHGDYGSGALTDPQGPSGGSDRVVRGGCWNRTAGFCRSASRGWNVPSIRLSYQGFRLALSPSGSMSPEAADTAAVKHKATPCTIDEEVSRRETELRAGGKPQQAAVVLLADVQTPVQTARYRLFSGGGYSGVVTVPLGVPWSRLEYVRNNGATRKLVIDQVPGHHELVMSFPLQAGEVRNLGRIVLPEIQDGEGTTLKGVVRIEEGGVAAGALVKLPGVDEVIRTDSVGSYRVGNLGLGERSVRVSLDGYATTVDYDFRVATKGSELVRDFVLFRPRSVRFTYALSPEDSTRLDGPGVVTGTKEYVLNEKVNFVVPRGKANDEFERFASDLGLRFWLQDGIVSRCDLFMGGNPVGQPAAHLQFDAIKDFANSLIDSAQAGHLAVGSVMVMRNTSDSKGRACKIRIDAIEPPPATR